MDTALQKVATKPGQAGLLMVGASASTFRLGDMVIEIPRIDEDANITHSIAKAMKIESNVYRILGQHKRIAECSYLSPMGDMVVLKHYTNGNIKRRLAGQHLGPGRRLLSWASQMIDGVAYLHSKGVRHSDLRLEQWLLDDDVDTIRLSDFNASGYDEQAALGLSAERAFGMEDAYHFLPKDADQDNTVRSDLFALGSALCELESGKCPYQDEPDEVMEEKFAKGDFPEVGGMVLGQLIRGAWEGRFESAEEMLEVGKRECGLCSDGPPYSVD